MTSENNKFKDFHEKILFEYAQTNDIPSNVHQLQQIGVNMVQSSLRLYVLTNFNQKNMFPVAPMTLTILF